MVTTANDIKVIKWINMSPIHLRRFESPIRRRATLTLVVSYLLRMTEMPNVHGCVRFTELGQRATLSVPVINQYHSTQKLETSRHDFLALLSERRRSIVSGKRCSIPLAVALTTYVK